MTFSREDIARVQHKIYRAMHAILDGIEARFDPPENPIRTALLRQASDIVGLWDWCGRNACWRARRCRRQHGECYAHCLPLLPKDVHAAVIARLRAFPSLREARKQLFACLDETNNERAAHFLIPPRLEEG